MGIQKGIIFALLLITLGTSGCSDDQQRIFKSNPQYVQLAKYITDTAVKEHVPGVAVAIVSHGKTVYFSSTGVADINKKDEVSQDTIFAMGSLTKSMTATAILQLRDKGLLKLGDPVQKYVPWFQVGNPAQAKEMTIYELLTQSSGLPTNAYLMVHDYLLGSPHTIENGVRELAKIPLDSSPGTSWEYSNMNYDVLGLIIQRVSGEPYTQYMDSQILEPLGMTHTTFDISKTDSEQRAGKYQLDPGSRVPDPVSPLDETYAFDDPAGLRLVSTVSDMSKYVAFQLGHGSHSVLSNNSVHEEHTNGVTATQEIDGSSATYAYGWFDEPGAGLPECVWHNGLTPGSTSLVVLYPSKDLGVIVFWNASGVPQLNPDEMTSILFSNHPV